MNLLLIPLAFVCEFVDSALGMGYGTTLTPLLLLLGFEPLQIVPAVLLSEFVSGITAASFHHTLENANFGHHSIDTKIAAALSSLSIVGVLVAVLFAVKLPPHVLKLWIGTIVLLMGVMILATRKAHPRFSWGKITVLGLVASFNKGMSGGGYGPFVMGGQVLSGVGVKNAVGITSLAEGLTCFVGVILYFCLGRQVDWALAPWLMAGAVLSVPFAAHSVKRVPEALFKQVVGFAVLVLGGLILLKCLT